MTRTHRLAKRHALLKAAQRIYKWNTYSCNAYGFELTRTVRIADRRQAVLEYSHFFDDNNIWDGCWASMEHNPDLVTTAEQQSVRMLCLLLYREVING